MNLLQRIKNLFLVKKKEEKRKHQPFKRVVDDNPFINLANETDRIVQGDIFTISHRDNTDDYWEKKKREEQNNYLDSESGFHTIHRNFGEEPSTFSFGNGNAGFGGAGAGSSYESKSDDDNNKSGYYDDRNDSDNDNSTTNDSDNETSYDSSND